MNLCFKMQMVSRGMRALPSFKNQSYYKVTRNCDMLYFIIFLTSVFLLGQSDKSSDDCENVEMVRREEWKARNEVRHFRVKLPLNHAIILHTVTRFCRTKQQCMRQIRAIQDMHLDARGWWDIAYNFLVGGDGRIYEGRGWKNSGAHSVNFNTNSLGIAFIGNYEKYGPTEAMINATLNFIACGVNKGYLTPTLEVHGHSDVSCTQSPGSYLYAIIRKWENYKGGRLPLYNCNRLGKPVVELEFLDY